jgi:hypothetical protein
MIKKAPQLWRGEPWGKVLFFGGSEEGCIGPAATQVFGASAACHKPFDGYQNNRSSKRNKRGFS